MFFRSKTKIIYTIILGLIFLADFSCFGAYQANAQTAGLTPNDTFYAKQWYLSALNMPKVWAQETGDSVVIAVIDSGVDITHPDLRDNIWVNSDEILGDKIDNDHNGYIDDISGWDFVTDTNDPSPKYDFNCLALGTCLQEAIIHGTFVAGVAAAVGNNGQGIAGISWTAKIMPLRVLSEDGTGNTRGVIRAINYAIDNGANIINLSFVGSTYDFALEQALIKAWQRGVLIVAAAGNEEYQNQAINLDTDKRYPVCHQGTNNENIVIGVGSVDSKNELTQFSNFGSSCVDIMAPGDDFFGVLAHNDFVPEFAEYYGGGYSGTSLAAPIVSGIAALIKAYKPSATNVEIRDLILNNADNIDALNPEVAGKLGHGLIDPVKIFDALRLNIFGSRLLRGSASTVYFLGFDGKRYVFPNEATYLSWYNDFSGIKKVADSDLAKLPLAGNVTMRPGSRLVKITTDPKVYAVSGNGTLRWIQNEIVARALYGLTWDKTVIDVPDAFFVNYKIGEDITGANDYDQAAEMQKALTIDADKGLK